MQKNTVGNYSIITLIVSLVLTKILISAPVLYVQHSKSGGWIEVLLSGVFEIFITALVIKLFLNFKNADIFQISEIAFGKAGGRVFGVFYTLVLLLNTTAVFRCFEELVRNTVLRGISYEAVGIFIAAGGVVAACYGIKNQISIAGLILPLIIVSVMVILFVNFSRLSVLNIKPVLGVGFDKIVKNALLKNSSYFEIGTIFLLTPLLRKKSAVKQIGFTAIAISIVLLSGITLLYQLAVPYEAAGTFSVPLYQMTRMLKAGAFFQRIEPLNIFIWCGSMFLYVGVGLWLSSYTFKKSFNLSDNKPIVFLFTVIVYFFALIPGSETNVERIYDFLMTYNYISYPIIPLIVLVIASIRGKVVKDS